MCEKWCIGGVNTPLPMLKKHPPPCPPGGGFFQGLKAYPTADAKNKYAKNGLILPSAGFRAIRWYNYTPKGSKCKIRPLKCVFSVLL